MVRKKRTENVKKIIQPTLEEINTLTGKCSRHPLNSNISFAIGKDPEKDPRPYKDQIKFIKTTQGNQNKIADYHLLFYSRKKVWRISEQTPNIANYLNGNQLHGKINYSAINHGDYISLAEGALLLRLDLGKKEKEYSVEIVDIKNGKKEIKQINPTYTTLSFGSKDKKRLGIFKLEEWNLFSGDQFYINGNEPFKDKMGGVYRAEPSERSYCIIPEANTLLRFNLPGELEQSLQ